MTIIVNTNADGTFTITCGAESVIVGTPATPAPAPAPVGTQPWPTIIPAGGHGTIAAVLMHEKPEPGDIELDADSMDEITRAVQEAMRTPAPSRLRVGWRGRGALDIAELGRQMREAGPRVDALEIHLLDP